MMYGSQDLDTALWEMNNVDPIRTTEYTGSKEERKEDFNDDEIFEYETKEGEKHVVLLPSFFD